MVFNLLRLFFIFLLIFIGAFGVEGQSNARDASGKSAAEKEDLPKNIKESLAKSRIEKEKKEYEETLQRGEEALRLSEELEKSFKENNKLSPEDQKKLDRLEKLAKKIRRELGGDANEETEAEDNPSTIQNALETLQNKTATLFKELKKATRYSISVIAVQSSNTLIKTVRFLRFNKN